MQAEASGRQRATSERVGRKLLAPRVPMARRSLLHDKIRFGMSLGGLAFAVVLVVLLRGLMDGTLTKSTTYIDHVGADVFISSAGVRNMTLASSALPVSAVESVRAIEGVADAGGMLRMEVIASHGNEHRPGAIIGYNVGHVGGPWRLASGRAVERGGEVVVDTALASLLGVDAGDQIVIADTTFTVVGRSLQTTAIAGKLIFMSLTDAQAILRMSDVVAFVLVKLEAGIDPGDFVTKLGHAMPDVTVQTRQALSNNDRDVLGGLFIAPINVMSTAGLLVGLAIVGLTMYTTTAERLRDFGVLKAIGASNRYLFQTVLTQAVALALMGFALGLVLVLLAAPIAERAEPDIGVEVRTTQAAIAFAEVVGMSLAGAILPLVRILRVDPLEAFRR